jgi:hypothetical protein
METLKQTNETFKDETPNQSTLSQALDACSATDFDGHTEFSRLTAEQKLFWLSQAAQFFYEANPHHHRFKNDSRVDSKNDTALDAYIDGDTHIATIFS